MLKKNFLTILIILAAILLIAIVIWIFNGRIKKVEDKMKFETTNIITKKK